MNKITTLIIIGGLVIMNAFIFIRNRSISSSNTALISSLLIDKNEEPKKEIIDTSEYALVMPVQKGTRWIYKGKRIFVKANQNKAQETITQKIIEITGIKKEGDNLRVFTKTSYKNEPNESNFKGDEDSFLMSESGYAFDGVNMAYFPLVKGQRLSPSDSDFERADNYYVSYVYSAGVRNVFGKQHRCYDVVYNTLPDESLDVFCEGIGYIRDSYKHHGTPDEWDYKLVSIEQPVLKK